MKEEKLHRRESFTMAFDLLLDATGVDVLESASKVSPQMDDNPTVAKVSNKHEKAN